MCVYRRQWRVLLSSFLSGCLLPLSLSFSFSYPHILIVRPLLYYAIGLLLLLLLLLLWDKNRKTGCAFLHISAALTARALSSTSTHHTHMPEHETQLHEDTFAL